MSESLARFTAEQTARFFGGGELGKPKWTDPEMQRKQDRQQALLQQALGVSVTQFNRALMELSPILGLTYRGRPKADADLIVFRIGCCVAALITLTALFERLDL
jgi:hypothetical protein